MHELRGRTLGLVGLGTIGKKTARLARAFGMNVQYYDVARLSEDAEDALGIRFRLLGEILRTSDIVSLHLPLNPSTRHLIGARELGMLKSTAVLVNTSRGPVVDETALIECLSAGRIFGAGLDVFDTEPPETDNPLFSLDNVVLSAHLAGPTVESSTARLRNRFRQRRARRKGRSTALGHPRARRFAPGGRRLKTPPGGFEIRPRGHIIRMARPVAVRGPDSARIPSNSFRW